MTGGRGLLWSSARSRCALDGGQLAVIPNQAVNNLVGFVVRQGANADQTNARVYRPAWIGLGAFQTGSCSYCEDTDTFDLV